MTTATHADAQLTTRLERLLAREDIREVLEGWCNGLFDTSKPGMRLGLKGGQDPSCERF